MLCFHLLTIQYDNIKLTVIFKHSFEQSFIQANPEFDRDDIQNSGICLTREPFLRSILQTIYKDGLNNLLRRTRIAIPEDSGRLMMVVVDETGSLEYGQVFVQYSKRVSQPQKEKIILTGRVVIAKNPCFHPGDLRNFAAVDAPALQHMIDCVVFPARGKRPHPNEMSGSDLDGDKYFVCWMDSLIPAEENRDPMDYPQPEKHNLDRPVEDADVIDFIVEYIETDHLGMTSVAHLVHADADKMGINSEKCLELAKLNSDAVDASKTGIFPTLPSDFRPACYPHYMMKTDKPVYTSNHVIGALFDQCRAVEQSRFYWHTPTLSLDSELVVSGHEKYMDSVEKIIQEYRRSIQELMMMYGVQHEAEIWLSRISKIKERLGFCDKDYSSITHLIHKQLQMIKTRIKTMFFEEFEKREGKRGRNFEKSFSDLPDHV